MITANANGVLRNLGEVTANDGGALRKLSTVHANDGGVLRQVFGANKTVSDLEIGTELKMNVDGIPRDFIIVHKGMSTAYALDGINDGIWVLMKDVYTTRAFSTSSIPNYNDMNYYLNNTFYKLLDETSKNAIKNVKIPYAYIDYDPWFEEYDIRYRSGSNGLQCNVFLLSENEVGWTAQYHPCVYGAGATLSYFKNTEKIDSKRIAYLDDVATDYWSRSVVDNDSYSYTWIITNSGSATYSTTNKKYGVRPAFILFPSAKIDKDGFVTI